MRVFLAIYSILSVLFVNVSYSQQLLDSGLTVHKKFEVRSRMTPYYYLGHNEKGHHFIFYEGKFANGSTYFIRTDHNLTAVLNQVLINTNVAHQSTKSIGVRKFNQKAYHFSYTKRDTAVNYYIQELSLDSFAVSPKRLLKNINMKGFRTNRSYSGLVECLDTNYFGMYANYPKHTEDTSRFSFYTFNKDLEIVSSYDYKLSKNFKKFSIIDGIQIDPKESIVLAGDLSIFLKQRYKPQNLDYNYHILRLLEYKVDTIIKFDNQNKWIRNFNFEYDHGVLTINGIYSNHGKYDFHGTFKYRLDIEKKEVLSYSFNPLDQEIYKYHSRFNLNSPIKGTKAKISQFQELPTYIMTDVYSDTNDKSRILLSEQRMLITGNPTIFVYGNIIATKLDSNGSKLWEKVIVKNNSRQTNPGYSGFYSHYNENGLWLLYNGTHRNLMHDKVPKKRYNSFANKHEGTLLLVKIDKSGQLTQYAIESRRNMDYHLIKPTSCFQLNDDEILIFTQHQANLRNQFFMTLDLRYY